jgi:hypothetical protein
MSSLKTKLLIPNNTKLLFVFCITKTPTPLEFKQIIDSGKFKTRLKLNDHQNPITALERFHFIFTASTLAFKS